jgi:hypothetical protein
MAAVRDTSDRAAKNRAIRHEALREQIQADQLIRQTLARIAKLDDGRQDANQVTAIRAANDASLRLLAKVLPDVKSVEVTGEGGGPVAYTFVNPAALSTNTLRELLAQREAASEQPADSG